MMDASAHHRVDVDVEIGVPGQNLQLLVQDLEALFRNIVGLHVVDRDLQVIESGAVEALDPPGRQQVAVGDHAGHPSPAPHGGYDLVEFGMQQRLAPGDGQNACSQVGQLVDPADHDLGGNGLRKIV